MDETELEIRGGTRGLLGDNEARLVRALGILEAEGRGEKFRLREL